MNICVAKEYPSHRLVANRLATKLAMSFPVHFKPAMTMFLKHRGEVLDSQPTRMVSLVELQELHDARKNAEQLGMSDHRRTSTSNSSTSSSSATCRTSIVGRQTSIAAPQASSIVRETSFPDAIEMRGEDHVDAPAPKRMIGEDHVDAHAAKRMRGASEC